MDDYPKQSPFFWENKTKNGRWRGPDASKPPGAELARLRRGLGREAGTVPEMWEFYTTLTESGSVSSRLWAEHVALSLFGAHSQSQDRPMHEEGRGFGAALGMLRRTERYLDRHSGLDRRFAAAATATSQTELSEHLRGLVSLLRSARPTAIALDYTKLFWDLISYQNPDRWRATRRRWGAQYFASAGDSEQGTLYLTGSIER